MITRREGDLYHSYRSSSKQRSISSNTRQKDGRRQGERAAYYTTKAVPHHLLWIAVSLVTLVLHHANWPPLANSSITTTTYDVNVTHAKYVSSYRIIIQSNAPPPYYLTWDAARTLCRGYGPGWGLGSMADVDDDTPLLSAFTTYLGSSRIWLGGYTSNVTHGEWIWADGRLKGVLFGTKPRGSAFPVQANPGVFQKWQATEPNYFDACPGLPPEYQVTAQGQYSNFQWGDMIPGHCTTMPSLQVLSALCERSECTLQADCTPANTISVKPGAYTPNCTCLCSAGYGGPKCEVRTGGWTSGKADYYTNCSATPITWTEAQVQCQQRGTEWHLATVSDAVINTQIISQFVAPHPPVWIGAGFPPASINITVVWWFGRDAGKFVSTGTGGGPVSLPYAPYAPSQPNRLGCTSGTYDQHVRISASTDTWEVASDAGCRDVKTKYTNCYVCQREHCSLSQDCSLSTTAELVGSYYPQCGCICINRLWKGRRCDITITVTLVLTNTPSGAPSSTVSLAPTLTHTTTPSNSNTLSRITLSATGTITQSQSTSITTSASITPTQTILHTLSATAALTPSVSHTVTHTGTLTASISRTPSYETLSTSTSMSSSVSQCEYTGGKNTALPACGALGRGEVWGNGTGAEVNVTCDSSELANANVTTVYVPYSVWGSGDVFQIRFPIAHVLGLAVIPNARSSGDSVNKKGTIVSHFELSGSARLTDTTHAHLTVNVSYSGYSTLAGVSTRMWIPVDAFIRCPILIAGGGVLGQGVPVDLQLAGDDVAEVPGIGEASVGIGIIGSVATGSPTALVRASMLSSLEGMLRCSEFDAEDKIQMINNPASWAVGPSELQYQRGSLLSGMIVQVVIGSVVCVVMAVARGLGEGVTTVGAAVTALRMPSVVLVAIAFVAEMSASSASSTVFLSRSGKSLVSDYLLSLACVLPVWAYVGIYGYQVTWGMRVDVVPVSVNGSDEDDDEKGDNDYHLVGDGKRARWSQRSRWHAALVYALEPTHVPCVRGHGLVDQDGQAAAVVDAELGAEERWLRRNYYFVADRRWAAYGAIEVAVGSLVDVIDGIPMTTRNPIACIGRPAAMVVLLTGLMVALVWKRPYSVRLQLWTAFLVVSLMLASSIMVTINAATVSSSLESFAAGLMAVAGLIVCVFSALDALLVMFTLVPALRRLMGLRASSLFNSIASMRKRAAKLKTLETPPTVHQQLGVSDDDDPLVIIDDDREDGSSGDELDQMKSSSSSEERIERRQSVEDEDTGIDEPAIQRMLLQEMEGLEEQQYCDEFFSRKC